MYGHFVKHAQTPEERNSKKNVSEWVSFCCTFVGVEWVTGMDGCVKFVLDVLKSLNTKKDSERSGLLSAYITKYVL